MLEFPQKILFIVGKGGVGRTSLACAFGLHYAEAGYKTLIVQWNFRDFIGPLFSQPPVGHTHKEVYPGLFVMNYDPEMTLKEYFVDHLHMGLFYNFILENPQVKKLIKSTPSLEEIFFLGRIFWLSELAREEKGYDFQKILVDTPATGHGISLFSLISTVAGFPFQGPLIYEATRTAKLLQDPEKTGIIVVGLPEELSFEETKESISYLRKEAERDPLALIVNKSIYALTKSFSHDVSFLDVFREKKEIAETITQEFLSRLRYEELYLKTYRNEIENLLFVPDVSFLTGDTSSLSRIKSIQSFFRTYAKT